MHTSFFLNTTSTFRLGLAVHLTLNDSTSGISSLTFQFLLMCWGVPLYNRTMNMDNQRRSLSHQFATVGDLSRRVRRNRATLLSSLVQDEDADYEHNNRLDNRNIDDDDYDDRHLPLSVMLRKFNLEHGYCDDEQIASNYWTIIRR